VDRRSGEGRGKSLDEGSTGLIVMENFEGGSGRLLVEMMLMVMKSRSRKIRRISNICDTNLIFLARALGEHPVRMNNVFTIWWFLFSLVNQRRNIINIQKLTEKL
jgi:hypothetical protein